MPLTGPSLYIDPQEPSWKHWLGRVRSVFGARWGTLLQQLLPSSLDLVLITAYLISLTATVDNVDVFTQIELGHAILQSGDIPTANLFSFTAPEELWIDNEWLAQVLLYGLTDLMGSHWLLFLRGLCFAGAMGLLYRLLRRMGGVLPALGLTFSAMVVAIPFLRIGPSMVAIPFLVLLLTLLEDIEWRRGASVFLLPPLFLLWANLHGSFFLGLMVLILHISGAIWDYRKGNGDSMWFYHLMGLLPAVLFSLWNPYYSSIYIQGISQVWTAVTLVPSFLSTPASVFTFFTVALLASITFYLTRLTFKRRLVLPFIGVGVFVLFHRDAMVEAVIVATVAIMQNLEQLAYQVRHGPEVVWEERQSVRTSLQRVGDSMKSLSAIDRRLTGRTYTYLTVMMTLVLFSSGGEASSGVSASIRLEDRVLPEIAPVLATDALIDVAFPKARVLAPVESSGYILYRGSPDIRVFIDARRGAYPQEIIEDYQRFSEMAPGWESILEYHQVDFILWRPDHFQPKALAVSGHWRVLYSDPYAILLGRTDGGIGPRAELLQSEFEKDGVMEGQGAGDEVGQGEGLPDGAAVKDNTGDSKRAQGAPESAITDETKKEGELERPATNGVGGPTGSPVFDAMKALDAK